MATTADRAVTTRMSEDTTVDVGWLYPTWWFGDDGAVRAEVARIEAVDPRVRVLVEPYQEGTELRTRRAAEGTPAGDEAPELTPSQRERFAQLDVALALDLPSPVAEVMPRLKWVQAVGAGTTHLWSTGIAETGVRLTSGAGTNAVAIAEFVIGRLLAHWKRFAEIAERQAARDWHATFGRELAGATVGLIGLGEINRRVARRLEPFDVEMLATRRRWSEPSPGVAEQFPPERLHDMLARCDAVIAAVPQTPATTDLMDGPAFDAMRSGSWFCNVGRGNLVDEPALIAALESGHLRGAAIDVARTEPLPPDDPLWDAPNLEISFHNAADPTRLFVNLGELFRRNLAAFLAGDPLTNEVEPPA